MQLIVLQISTFGIVALSLLAVFVVSFLILFFTVFPVAVWLRAWASGCYIPIKKIVAMKIRKVDFSSIIAAHITAKKSGLNLSLEDLETHVLAGGNIDSVVKAMIAARSADIFLSMQTAMAIDLAGRDVLDVVKTCITPKLIETQVLKAVPGDGQEVKVKAQITIRSNLGRFLGGADENTIIARVSESVVTIVGSAQSHKAVLENPDVITDTILSKSLDKGTSFEILSIDISEIELGKNLAQEFVKEQMEADKKLLLMQAEERRLAAVALEQENKAKIQLSKAQAVDAEAEIHKALAKAISEKQISPLDYYDIENLQADTKMRNALSGQKLNNSESSSTNNRVPGKRNPFGF